MEKQLSEAMMKKLQKHLSEATKGFELVAYKSENGVFEYFLNRNNIDIYYYDNQWHIGMVKADEANDTCIVQTKPVTLKELENELKSLNQRSA